MDPAREHGKYCSTKCRVAAARARKKQEAGKGEEPEKAVPKKTAGARRVEEKPVKLREVVKPVRKVQEDINAGAREAVRRLKAVSMPPSAHVPANLVLSMMKSRLPSSPVVVPRGVPILHPKTAKPARRQTEE